MEKGNGLEADLDRLNETGANFFAKQELEEGGAVFSEEQGGYVLGDKLYQYMSDDLYKRVR